MPQSYGYRARTRHLFAREFRKHGQIKLSTYMTTYKVGDYVDIKVNGSIHKGMPFRYYHGRTGKVFNVGKRSLGVIIEKQVGNKYHEKRICVRLEHVKPSRCREDYLKRKAENRERKLLAQKNGTVFKPIKRMPEEPKRAHLVSTKNNDPVLVTPIAYERLI